MKERAIRNFVRFTFLGFRLRYQADLVRRRHDNEIQRNSIREWKTMLRRQLLLRNALYVYVKRKAHLCFANWKRDVDLSIMSDEIKNDIAVKHARKVWRVWAKAFFLHRAVKVVRRRTLERELRTLVIPAFYFFKSFRIKMIRFRNGLKVTTKRNCWKCWMTYVHAMREKKRRILVADEFFKSRRFARLSGTCLRLSQERAKIRAALFVHLSKRARVYLAFWNKLARRRAWWKNATALHSQFYRASTLGRAFFSMSKLTISQASRRGKMVQKLRSVRRDIILRRHFFPWNEYAKRSVDNKYKVRRALERRRFDVWWKTIRMWKDWVASRKYLRRKSKFLEERVKERVRRNYFSRYRISFFWQQIYRVVVNKKNDILVKRCFCRFQNMVQKLRRGRDRAELLLQCINEARNAKHFDAWAELSKRRVATKKNFVIVSDMVAARRERDVLGTWKERQRKSLDVTGRHNKVRRLVGRSLKRKTMAYWTRQAGAFRRAREYWRASNQKKVLGEWKCYSNRTRAKGERARRMDRFADCRRKSRAIRALVNFTKMRFDGKREEQEAELYWEERACKVAIEKLCKLCSHRVKCRHFSGVASDWYRFRMSRTGVLAWRRWAVRRKRERKLERNRVATVLSWGIARWMKWTEGRIRRRERSASGARAWELRCKCSFLDKLHALRSLRITERMNVRTGQSCYEHNVMQSGFKNLCDSLKRQRKRRASWEGIRSIADSSRSQRGASIGLKTWIVWAEARRQRRLLLQRGESWRREYAMSRALVALVRCRNRRKERRRAITVLEKIYCTKLLRRALKLLRLVVAWRNEKYDMAERFRKSSLLRAALRGFRGQMSWNAKVRYWYIPSDESDGSGGRLERRAVKTFLFAAVSVWKEFCKDHQRLELLADRIAMNARSSVRRKTWRTWKQLRLERTRVRRFRLRWEKKAMERVWELWCAFEDARRSLKAKIQVVEAERARLNIWRTWKVWRRRLRESRKQKLVEGRRRLEEQRGPFRHWRDAWKDREEEKRAIASLKAAVQAMIERKEEGGALSRSEVVNGPETLLTCHDATLINPYKCILRLRFLLLGKSLSKLRWYATRSALKRSLKGVADGFRENRTARDAVIAWREKAKEWSKERRCLRICQEWRAARVCKVALERMGDHSRASKESRDREAIAGRFWLQRRMESAMEKMEIWTEASRAGKARTAKAEHFRDEKRRASGFGRLRSAAQVSQRRKKMIERNTEIENNRKLLKVFGAWESFVEGRAERRKKAEDMKKTFERRNVACAWMEWTRRTERWLRDERLLGEVKRRTRGRSTRSSFALWRSNFVATRRKKAAIHAWARTISRSIESQRMIRAWAAVNSFGKWLSDANVEARNIRWARMETLLGTAWKLWKGWYKCRSNWRGAMRRRRERKLKERAWEGWTSWRRLEKRKRAALDLAEEKWRGKALTEGFEGVARNWCLQKAERERLEVAEGLWRRTRLAEVLERWTSAQRYFTERKRRYSLGDEVRNRFEHRVRREALARWKILGAARKRGRMIAAFSAKAQQRLDIGLLSSVLKVWKKAARAVVAVRVRSEAVRASRDRKVTRKFLDLWRCSLYERRANVTAVVWWENKEKARGLKGIAANCRRNKMRRCEDAVRKSAEGRRFKASWRDWRKKASEVKKARRLMTVIVMERWRSLCEERRDRRDQSDLIRKEKMRRFAGAAFDSWRWRCQGWKVKRIVARRMDEEWRMSRLRRALANLEILRAEGRDRKDEKRAREAKGRAVREMTTKRAAGVVFLAWRQRLVGERRRKKAEDIGRNLKKRRDSATMARLLKEWRATSKAGAASKFRLALARMYEVKFQKWSEAALRRKNGVGTIMAVAELLYCRRALARWSQFSQSRALLEACVDLWRSKKNESLREADRALAIAETFRIQTLDGMARAGIARWRERSRRSARIERARQCCRAMICASLSSRCLETWKELKEDASRHRDAEEWRRRVVLEGAIEAMEESVNRKIIRRDALVRRSLIERSIVQMREEATLRKLWRQWKGEALRRAEIAAEKESRSVGLRIIHTLLGRWLRRNQQRALALLKENAAMDAKREDEIIRWTRLRWGMRIFTDSIRVKREREGIREGNNRAQAFWREKWCQNAMEGLFLNARSRRRQRELTALLGRALDGALTLGAFRAWKKFSSAQRGARRLVAKREAKAAVAALALWETWCKRRKSLRTSLAASDTILQKVQRKRALRLWLARTRQSRRMENGRCAMESVFGGIYRRKVRLAWTTWWFGLVAGARAREGTAEAMREGRRKRELGKIFERWRARAEEERRARAAFAAWRKEHRCRRILRRERLQQFEKKSKSNRRIEGLRCAVDAWTVVVRAQRSRTLAVAKVLQKGCMKWSWRKWLKSDKCCRALLGLFAALEDASLREEKREESGYLRHWKHWKMACHQLREAEDRKLHRAVMHDRRAKVSKALFALVLAKL